MEDKVRHLQQLYPDIDEGFLDIIRIMNHDICCKYSTTDESYLYHVCKYKFLYELPKPKNNTNYQYLKFLIGTETSIIPHKNYRDNYIKLYLFDLYTCKLKKHEIPIYLLVHKDILDYCSYVMEQIFLYQYKNVNISLLFGKKIPHIIYCFGERSHEEKISKTIIRCDTNDAITPMVVYDKFNPDMYIVIYLDNIVSNFNLLFHNIYKTLNGFQI